MKHNNIRFAFVLIFSLLAMCVSAQKAPADTSKAKPIPAAPPKTYVLEAGQALITSQLLILLKNLLPSAETLSAKEANTTIPFIDSIQRVLYRQSIDTTKKK